jgi:hypothetical protein
MIDRISPARYHQWRNNYHVHALAALEPLRKALGYEPRLEVIPDQQAAAIAPLATWDHRVTAPAGSFLWAISGSSQQPEGFTVQITDFATRSDLFSGPLHYDNATGQGSVSVPDSTGATVAIGSPLHMFSMPRPIVGQLNVQLSNLSASANQAQIVLWIWAPPAPDAPGNDWNSQLDSQVADWEHMTLPAIPGSPMNSTKEDPALLAPAYTKAFNIGGTPSSIIVPGSRGLRIAIHQVSLYNAVLQQTITYQDAEGNDLRGALTNFGIGGADYLPYQSDPHFVLPDGSSFVIAMDGLGLVSGFVKYRMLSSYTPGRNT